MACRNYKIGRSFEYRIINYLRKKGYYCLRSYGSHGLYDILAIPPTNPQGMFNYPLMIQAKTNNYIKPAERESLKQNKNTWQGFQLIAYKDDSGKILFRTLDGHKIVSV